MGVARGAAEFRRKAEEAVAGGADVLKVIASGAVLAFGGVPGDPEMTPEEIAAVVQVAHAAGLRVAAHAHGARSIREAIGAGVDTIEHASLIDDAGIELARERGVALSMDIYNGDYIDTEGRAQGWPEEFLRKNIETTEATASGLYARAPGRGRHRLRHRRRGLPARAQCPAVPDHGRARHVPRWRRSSPPPRLRRATWVGRTRSDGSRPAFMAT
jgi:imidazolonepropionase-like amidohydrolase